MQFVSKTDRKHDDMAEVEHTHKHTLTDGETYNAHPGGSVESSSAHSVLGGTPHSSAPPRCLSFLLGS